MRKPILFKKPHVEENRPILAHYHETLYSSDLEDLHKKVDKIIGGK